MRAAARPPNGPLEAPPASFGPFPLLARRLSTVIIHAASKAYNAVRGRSHKPHTDWAYQGMPEFVRWLPDRRVVFVGNSSYAVMDLRAAFGRAVPGSTGCVWMPISVSQPLRAPFLNPVYNVSVLGRRGNSSRS
jgi:hypothetical protein